MSQELEIHIVDAFAEEAFSGNPAAVCFLVEPISTELMQKIASEMNLSETAFVLKDETDYRLRWFTPNSEVDLCGHATLASAHALIQSGREKSGNMITFDSLSGQLTAQSEQDGSIVLNFPEKPAKPSPLPQLAIDALNIQPIFTGENRMDYLIEIETEEELYNIEPDFKLLGQIPKRGFIITCKASDGYDFKSRFFAPFFAIDEDPFTGSAHCCSGPYWRDKLCKSQLTAYQASSRGGSVSISFSDDRVLLKGGAHTRLVGQFFC